MTLRDLIHWMRVRIRRDPDRFLNNAHGVIHVGANEGQEREQYAELGLTVLWIEPIPQSFQALQENLRGFPQQWAVQALVTDRDDVEYDFNVANNGGAASSLLAPKEMYDYWPDMRFDRTIQLRSVTLPSLLEREQVDPGLYDTLILDVQGAELLILEGAGPNLEGFRYVRTEVANYEAYKCCCQLEDIVGFMNRHHYREIARHKFARHSHGRAYFDLVFERIR